MNKILGWDVAEQLRLLGVPLEYRDGTMRHNMDWHRVDGPLTEHCSDFDFRLALMTEARAREILAGELTAEGHFANWSTLGNDTHIRFGADGLEFSVDEIEAIAWWMRNKGK